MEDPIFLTLDHVLRLHDRQIESFGGSDGIRDISLIESAIAQPQHAFGGDYIHKNLAGMAAAYLFYLAKNHGFVDGNKRTAFVAALTFLDVNDVDTDRISEDDLEAITLAIAEGTADRNVAVEFFTARIKIDD